jgi:hypothetical protein
MPASSAALMESSSRIDPPGWIIAVIPAFAAASTQSENGKNASDAHHGTFYFIPAVFYRKLQRRDAVGLAGADADGLIVLSQALCRWTFVCLTTFHDEDEGLPSPARSARVLVTHFMSFSMDRAARYRAAARAGRRRLFSYRADPCGWASQGCGRRKQADILFAGRVFRTLCR